MLSIQGQNALCALLRILALALLLLAMGVAPEHQKAYRADCDEDKYNDLIQTHWITFQD